MDGDKAGIFSQGINSLDAHQAVPYCQRLCWYCGCNTTVKRDRSAGDALVDSLIAELDLLGPWLPAGARLGQLSLGGGTPNFLSTAALTRWVGALEAVRGGAAGAIWRLVDDLRRHGVVLGSSPGDETRGVNPSGRPDQRWAEAAKNT